MPLPDIDWTEFTMISATFVLPLSVTIRPPDGTNPDTAITIDAAELAGKL